MERRRNRYKEMERYLTYALLGAAGVFLLYLLAAGFGIIWLKVTLAIVAVAASGLALAHLYMTGELMKIRSRWLTFGFAAIVLLVLVSMILNYPSPDPLKQLMPGNNGATEAASAMIRAFFNI